MKFGPNGDLYVLEYGDAGFRPAGSQTCGIVMKEAIALGRTHCL